MDLSLSLSLGIKQLVKVIDAVKATPNMTSNTAPSGTVSASTFSTNLDPYKAFNGVKTDYSGWKATAATGWLQYQFTSQVLILQYKILSNSAQTTTTPTDWTIQGSNDGVGFTTIATVASAGMTPGVEYTYLIDDPALYSYYRFDGATAGGLLQVEELEYYAGTIS